ncbi:MAG: winged helix-turn-helix domain-containing protein [Rhodanobacteraceae bacterium]|nr:winged helix-turn-helix domain-containing protein [Rhodanobacteraceae bacterium]
MPERTLPWPIDTRLIRIGEIEIDLRYRSVSRAGVAHELNPRCFELLLLFLSEPRALHTRDAIFRKVWRGAVVEDANLTTSVWLLRRALGTGAKQWIRTISKQGYIFDPPTGLEFELIMGEEPVAPAIAAEPELPAAQEAEALNPVDAMTVAQPLPDQPVPTAKHGWAITLAAAACLCVMLLTGGLLGARARESTPLRVVLVVAGDNSLPEAQRWPVRLLQHWLSWQLHSTPRIKLHNPSDIAVDGSETVVLVDLAAPTQGSEWRISAHFRGSIAQTPIVQRAAAQDLVPAIAQLSDEVFARLTASENYTGPRLAIDAAAAQLLTDAVEAEEQHRWGDAIRHYTGVVSAAPDMGFARFHLARSLGRLGQRNAARAELARAADWVDGLPEFLRTPLRAESLLINEQYAAAAAALTALNKAGHDHRIEYRIAGATSLRRAGRLREAAEHLGESAPAIPGLAVAWLLEQAEVSNADGNFHIAASSARQSLELAQALGWEHDRAHAAFVLADAYAGNGNAIDPGLLRQAEQSFAASGDRLGVLQARVRLELERNRRVSDEVLNQLLAEAHAVGNTHIEIDMLQRIGSARFRAGDADAAHARLTQAAAVAESSGNPFEQRRIDLQLLPLDLLRLDFDDLDQRLERLDIEPLQGVATYVTGLHRARLQYWRGEFDGALRTLEDAERQLRKSTTDDLPQNLATMSCTRAAIRVVQGRPADARAEYGSCRLTSTPLLERLADVGEAGLAIQAGDATLARRLLMPLPESQTEAVTQPERWHLAAEIAPLLARIGELGQAKALVDRTLPLVQAAGYRLLETNLRITRAEIALAEGRPGDAEREIQQVEKVSPPDYWSERRRIRTVRALTLQARGDVGGAAQALDTLHTDARARGDVLGELLAHSVMVANAATVRCPDERHQHLVATSGMSGASDLWMNPAGRDRARVASLLAQSDHATP